MNDDLRNLLRDADPARDAEMSPIERARIKAAMAGAASRASRSTAPLLGMAMVTAASALAVILAIPSRPRTIERVQAPAPAPEPAPIVAPPRPLIVAAARPSRTRRAQVRPAVLDVAPRTTRIEFIAPEGTKIIWFVGTPDAKELGS